MEVMTAGGVRIVNDTYNANPDSVRSALETLSLMHCRGKRIVILADMLELGADAAREHREIGKAIDRKDVGVVLTFGPMGRLIADNARTDVARHFSKKRQLAAFAKKVISPGDLVLVKGSRGMKMEEIVTDLQETLGRKAA
jgi:UDP-N-acetylmuramyl pentapeptide synthase